MMKGWGMIKPFAIAALLWHTGSIFAQTDSLDRVNRLSIGLDFLTHGEACGGGLPKSVTEESAEDRSSFLLGERPGQCGRGAREAREGPRLPAEIPRRRARKARQRALRGRSEERRVGKEC